jgi:UDP-2,3-diacylglucosamine hydrolase
VLTNTLSEIETRTIGLIAGNGPLPLIFAQNATRHGYKVIVVAHKGEASKEIESMVEHCEWINVGQLGKIIDTFTHAKVSKAAMLGGINRVKLFNGVKLDLRGAMLLSKLRSMKDDVIMRGVANELLKSGIEIIPSTYLMDEHIVTEGVLTKSSPTQEELHDIKVGTAALIALSSQDIGQLVVVKDGVIVAVEAVEGTDKAILRGGELGGKGCVVVKFSKTTQDLRFDVPTIGRRTIEKMIEIKARVLAVEAGCCLLIDREKVIKLANKNKIAIIGCKPLKSTHRVISS